METRINKAGELKKGAIIFITALVIVAAIATAFVLWKEGANNELAACGATICGEFNQEYRGWVQDTLECTYSYERFGYPEVEEVFVFIINQSMIDRMCTPDYQGAADCAADGTCPAPTNNTA
jgi:hypothetical protein